MKAYKKLEEMKRKSEETVLITEKHIEAVRTVIEKGIKVDLHGIDFKALKNADIHIMSRRHSRQLKTALKGLISEMEKDIEYQKRLFCNV